MATDNLAEKLYATTDAGVWAEEFMRVVEAGATVDFGLMVAWFANAIETAKAHAGAEVERLRAELDEAQLRSIEARNPGIDMDEVRRARTRGQP